MSYRESVLVCDWCVKDIEDGASVACGKCMTEMEKQISDLKTEIEKLEEEKA